MSRFDEVEPTYFELLRQGGLVAAFADAARIFHDAAREMSNALHGCAMALDRERRGHASVGHRIDAVAVGETIRDLLRGDLLSDRERQRLRELIAAELRDPTAGAPAPAAAAAQPPTATPADDDTGPVGMQFWPRPGAVDPDAAKAISTLRRGPTKRQGGAL